ncbi:MAG: potassium-transporting ATPase subunit KdpA [Alphaproteobacteria bacterium]|nr:potassium-transporting ATPase subunit KdpA [Alphaproteobacteria bacterium]
MMGNSLLQFAFFAFVTMVLAIPCAHYFTRLFAPKAAGGGLAFEPLERLLTKVVGPKILHQQNWKEYLLSLIVFNLVGAVFLYLMLRLQGYLPWNPEGFGNIPPALALNITLSWLTDTGWQAYAGETTLSFFSQMVALTSQNFLSCATGLGVSFAVARAFIQRENSALGNFYADVARSTFYVLLPLTFFFALFLIDQGIPQNLDPSVQATTLEGASQTISQGPIASQIAAKIIGANGGGFFHTNAAHPYENPTPLTNMMQIVAILVIPIALVLFFGQIVGDKRQGWSLFAGLTILFLILVFLCAYFEQMHHPVLSALNVDQKITSTNPGGNMEGKEVRCGIFTSALWTVATTSTTQGSVNSSLDSYMPLGAVVPLLNMLFGEVVYGGVGYGRYGVLIYAMITVFIAGLKVGRTPEYLGKKIEAREIKLAGLVMLITPICVLGFSLASLLLPQGAASIMAEGPHGLTQTVYAYASSAANNGTAFNGFNADTVYQNLVLGLVILIGRFGVIIPALAIAGSLAAKKIVPQSVGTFSTQGPLFVLLLTSTIILFGGLVYFPMLALGPVAEHLALFAH